MMLEGKEIDVKIGNYGTASVDVGSDLRVKVNMNVELDLISEAKKLAAKSNTPIDDKAIEWLEAITRGSEKPKAESAPAEAAASPQ